MTTRLVSILGLGPSPEQPHYEPTAYTLDATPASPTPLVQRALIDLEPDIGSVVLLGTAAVKERWIDTGLAREILGRDFGFTLLPDGATSDERWQIFHKVARALRADLIDELEDDDPDAILLDVTHGFRLQPMLGLAALSFVRSDEARDGYRPTPVRVTYGAYEARDRATNVAPIWDLTELMVAAEWNSAFDAFIRYGRADEVHRLGLDTARAHRHEPAAARALETFAKTARRFADDTALARTSSIFQESAEALRGAISHPDLQSWLTRLPVLGGPLETLLQRLRRLRSSAVVSREGLRAQVALARTQFDTGQFASAAVAIREGLVDLAALALNRADALEPSLSRSTEEARKFVEDKLQNAWDDPRSTRIAPIAQLRNRFRRVRNDILHGGRDRPAKAEGLRDLLRRAVEDFDALVKDLTR
ncbi:MAG: TM1812 family CRISPR-associated protein [Deltaproteobacteria bacterium]|nr:TM1812 family CRISPR-associated protein [Deltaproteobacteria bacterium]